MALRMARWRGACACAVLLGVASCEGATAVDRRAARAIEDPVVPPVLPAPPSCGFRRQVSGTTENLSAA